MRKYLIFTLGVPILFLSTVQAQQLPADSIKNIALTDARKFKLDKADFEIFRHNRRNSGSDYFKPGKSAVSDTALLKDSVYVKAYRAAAYAKTRHRHTAGHYVLLGGVAVTVVVLVALAAATNSVLTGYH
ncbi:MAG TPA: hypothetical protein VHE59_08230 [Mucilaginibacter sp.]|nr:hypothetical protein [Mucilaginibacter sp.]